MSVYISRGAEIAVTEPFLYLLHLDSVCKKETGRAMTKIMETHMSETMFLQEFRKLTGDISGLHTFSKLV